MPYNPGVTDISGQLRAQGTMQAGQNYGNALGNIGQAIGAFQQRKEKDKETIAAVKGTAQFLKTNAQLLGVDENTVADLTTQQPNESPLAWHSRMGAFMSQTMQKPALQKAQAEIDRAKAETDSYKQQLSHNQFILGEMNKKRQEDEALNAKLSQFVTMGSQLEGGVGSGVLRPDTQRAAAEFSKSPAGQLVSQGVRMTPDSMLKLTEMKMNNDSRGAAGAKKPPMIFPSLETLEAKFPSKQYDYQFDVNPENGQVTVPNISPRAPMQAQPEVPNPLVDKIYGDMSTERSGSVLPALKTLDSLGEIGHIIDADNPNFISGAMAEPELFLKRMANAVGAKYEDVANTQVLRSLFAVPVAQIIKNFGSGTGLSDADREFAKQAAGGDIALDASSIKRLVSISRTASENIRGQYEERLNQVFPGNTDNAQYRMARTALVLPSKKKTAQEIYEAAIKSKKP